MNGKMSSLRCNEMMNLPYSFIFEQNCIVIVVCKHVASALAKCKFMYYFFLLKH